MSAARENGSAICSQGTEIECAEIVRRVDVFLDKSDPLADHLFESFKVYRVRQRLEHRGRDRADAGLLAVVRRIAGVDLSLDLAIFDGCLEIEIQ